MRLLFYVIIPLVFAIITFFAKTEIITSLSWFLNLFGFTWKDHRMDLLPTLLPLIAILYIKLVEFVIPHYNIKELAKDLHPYYSEKDIEKAIRCYIPTKYQNNPPSQGDEPSRGFEESPKAKLIPMFLKRAFEQDRTRFHLILADSGMGKTTFMINLYLKYKLAFAWGDRKYQIKLYPLGDPLSLSEINKIENKSNTILLLDALNEDIEAIKDYKSRLTEILKETWEFRQIIITCRTQFFPSQEEEPHKTGFFKYGSEGGEFFFRKYYISVFDNRDIILYLTKKYNLINPLNWIKFKRAYNIVQKILSIAVRPMLLLHISDLESEESNYDYSYQIYDRLIKKWIEREAKKPFLLKKYNSPKDFEKLLFQFSRNLALNIYHKRQERGNLQVPKEEILQNSQLQLSDLEAHLKEESIDAANVRNRSLLNRDVDGNYKFSHKSILEFFIAEEAFKKETFRKSLKGNDLDTAHSFLLDMLREQQIQEWKSQNVNMSSQNINKKLGFITESNHLRWYKLGILSSENSDYSKAIEYYKKAIEIKPIFYKPYNEIGHLYNKVGNYQIAIKYYSKVIEIKPYNYSAFNNIGVVHDSLGNYQKAIEYYKKAIKIKPDFYNAFNNMGFTYDNIEDYNKAIECYKKAIEIKPDFHNAFHNIGVTYDKIGAYDKAIEYYKKVANMNPTDDSIFHNMGFTYNNKGEYDKAIESYKKAINIESNDKITFFNIGISYNQRGNYNKAIEYYRKAIEIKPDFYDAFNNMGISYNQRGDYNKAIECYKKAIEIKPDFYDAFNRIGIIYRNEKDYKKAIFYFLKAWELSNYSRADILIELGHVFLLKGNKAISIHWYKKSIPYWKYHTPFLKKMKEDFLILKMEKEGVDQESYNTILSELENYFFLKR